MNQQIIKLAQQAGIIGQSETVLAPTVEQFAKLIVAECANIADEQCVIATDHVFGVGQELLDHFGVKE